MVKRASSTPLARATRCFRKAGGTLRASQARVAGIHPRTLRSMLDHANITRIGRGLYRLSDAPRFSNPDLVTVALNAPTAVVCLISALAFRRLTTQIPHSVDIAIAQGARTPKIAHPPIRVYRFSERSLAMGVETLRLDGVVVRMYCAEKTLADCFKFRNKVGLDVGIEALRMYLRRRDARVEEVLRYAQFNRVKRIMMPYIEAML